MRILLVTNGYPPAARGGVETYTQSLAQTLQARGHTVEVFCRVSDPRRPEYAVLVEAVSGIPVRRVVNDLTGAPDFEDHYRDPRPAALFRRHVAEFRPDVVHVQHTLGLSAAILPAAQALGRPLLATLHDFWYFCPRATLFDAERRLCPGPGGEVDCVRCLGGVQLGPLSPLQRLPAYKWLLARLPARLNRGLRARLDRPNARAPAPPADRGRHRAQMMARTRQLLEWLSLADRLLAPSAFVKELYVAQGLPAERLAVLPLGVERGPARPRRAGPFTVAFIGSLQYHKGPDLLVEAWRQAPEWPAHLRLFGAGAPGETYAGDLRQSAGGDPRITFHEPFPRGHLADVLAEVDVLAVPSRCYETYSLAAREALLAGTPVVAAGLGALTEVVQPGVNGVLVPPDNAAALAAGLRRAQAELEALRAGALRFTAPGPAEHVAELETLYRALLR